MNILDVKNFFFMNGTATRRKFYNDFAKALKDSIDPRTRIKRLYTISEKSRSWKRDIYGNWLFRLDRSNFLDAISVSIPMHEYMVLKAAETDGRLREAMAYLVSVLKLQGKIKGIYMLSYLSPFMAGISLFISIVLNAKLIGPMNLESLPLRKWPATSKFLYEASTAIVDNAVISVGIMVGVFWLIMWSRSRWVGPVREIFDKLPLLPWKGYKKNQADNFLVSMALIMQSNSVGFAKALEIMRQYSSPWLGWYIGKMMYRLQIDPQKPALAMQCGLFDVETMERIEDLAERSSFYEALSEIALEDSEEKVDVAQRNATLGAMGAIVFGLGVMALFAVANMEFNQVLQQSIR
ncbi:hypothetical protein [Comamonas testosteroni]|uniref:hypothetical protein n=1 Tax=Comamonas testosteroni TaxID=285 RepID=UPI0005B53CC8|nr:hypothetical protein [Comamonas testosteroni]